MKIRVWILEVKRDDGVWQPTGLHWFTLKKDALQSQRNAKESFPDIAYRVTEYSSRRRGKGGKQ